MAVLLYFALRLIFPLLLIAAILLALFLRVLPMRREIRRQRREWDSKYVEGELLPEEPDDPKPIEKRDWIGGDRGEGEAPDEPKA